MAASVEQDLARFMARNTYFAVPDNAAHITSDVCMAVHAFRMAHKVAPWGETGQRRFCIYGPLPFPFKGRMYAVPVQVWLTANYPVDPPTVYVVPTSDTHRLVSGHRAVDATGLCYCPALAKWRPDASTIKPMLVQLIKIFCYFPPVWEARSGEGGSGGGGMEGGAGGGQSADAAAALLTSAGVDTGSDPEARLCVICLSEPKDTVIVPCGHCCSCSTCAANLTACPMCRGKIQFRQRVYV
jgi:ubiquitin-protein ligase